MIRLLSQNLPAQSEGAIVLKYIYILQNSQPALNHRLNCFQKSLEKIILKRVMLSFVSEHC